MAGQWSGTRSTAVAVAAAVGLGRLHNSLFGLDDVPEIEMALPPARVIALKASGQ